MRTRGTVWVDSAGGTFRAVYELLSDEPMQINVLSTYLSHLPMQRIIQILSDL